MQAFCLKLLLPEHTFTILNISKNLWCCFVPLQLYTDRYVVHAVHKAAMLHSKAGHRPIYQYNFAYRGAYTYALLAEIGNTPMNIGELLW
jgi:hypothetical protein